MKEICLSINNFFKKIKNFFKKKNKEANSHYVIFNDTNGTFSTFNLEKNNNIYHKKSSYKPPLYESNASLSDSSFSDCQEEL